MQMRQGDVYLEKVEIIPTEATEVMPKEGKLILAEGEATGHHHSVSAQNAMLFLLGTTMYLKCLEQTMLKHQEHEKIELDPGLYKITRQREYSPEAIRNVRD